ncbi:MAG: DUF2017 domain-containing protein [Acidimicrobiia bacterium]|nr:DUF2017 domain-containing protein [Acidimicrobiia bacterium]
MSAADEGGAVVAMDADVVELLLRVVDDVDALVADPGIAGAEVARRLVPDAHRDDPEAAADYRRVVGPQLAQERSEAAATMRAGLLAADQSSAASAAAPAADAALVDTAVSLAADAGLGDAATSLSTVWHEAAAGSTTRSRVVDELSRVCERAARSARKRGDAELEGKLTAVRDELLSMAPVSAAVVEVRLSPAEVEAWMLTVNHARLAIGTACGVSEEQQVWAPDDPRIPQMHVYDLLTDLLDHLVREAG